MSIDITCQNMDIESITDLDLFLFVYICTV